MSRFEKPQNPAGEILVEVRGFAFGERTVGHRIPLTPPGEIDVRRDQAAGRLALGPEMSMDHRVQGHGGRRHIAVGMGVPTVCLIGPSDRYTNYRLEQQVVIQKDRRRVHRVMTAHQATDRQPATSA